MHVAQWKDKPIDDSVLTESVVQQASPSRSRKVLNRPIRLLYPIEVQKPGIPETIPPAAKETRHFDPTAPVVPPTAGPNPRGGVGHLAATGQIGKGVRVRVARAHGANRVVRKV